jgi:hypothetical protein
VDAEDADHKFTYLKTAMLKFMLTPAHDTVQKESLMRVIATILHFSPDEASSAQRSIADGQALAAAAQPVTLVSAALGSLFSGGQAQR